MCYIASNRQTNVMPISCVGTVLVQSSRWPVSLLCDAAAWTAGLHTFSECGQPTCPQGPAYRLHRGPSCLLRPLRRVQFPTVTTPFGRFLTCARRVGRHGQRGLQCNLFPYPKMGLSGCGPDKLPTAAIDSPKSAISPCCFCFRAGSSVDDLQAATQPIATSPTSPPDRTFARVTEPCPRFPM